MQYRSTDYLKVLVIYDLENIYIGILKFFNFKLNLNSFFINFITVNLKEYLDAFIT